MERLCGDPRRGEQQVPRHAHRALGEHDGLRPHPHDAVVALGGGVGVAIWQVPAGHEDFRGISRRLLAQVDSVCGGEAARLWTCGREEPGGACRQPELVLMETSPTACLNGMAEVIEYGCIQDTAAFLNLPSPGRGEIMARSNTFCIPAVRQKTQRCGGGRARVPAGPQLRAHPGPCLRAGGELTPAEPRSGGGRGAGPGPWRSWECHPPPGRGSACATTVKVALPTAICTAEDVAVSWIKRERRRQSGGDDAPTGMTKAALLEGN